MKRLARIGLSILGSFMSVVIAACYGVSANSKLQRQKCGKALDSQTQTAIKGIQVTCSENGAESDMAYTLEDGSFCVSYLETAPCDTLTFQDVDGTDNGGQYQTQAVPMVDDGQGVTVELVK